MLPSRDSFALPLSRCFLFPIFTSGEICSCAIGIMLGSGLETGLLLCEVEGKGELMGDKGWGLIVAEASSFVAGAYAAAVDLRIAMIFCLCPPSVRPSVNWPLDFDFRRAIKFVDCMVTRSESTKSFCSSDVGLE